MLFFQQRLDSKRENGRVTKVKEDEINVFLSTSKQSPEKNSQVLQNRFKFFTIYSELLNPQVKMQKYDIYTAVFSSQNLKAQRLVDNVTNAHLVAASILFMSRMMRCMMWSMLPSWYWWLPSSMLWWFCNECNAFDQVSY